MTSTIVFDAQTTFVTAPVNPCAGQDFTVSWQERNAGDEDSGQYEDIFDLDDQGSGDSQKLQCDPLQAGASTSRSLTFNLPAGDYTMSLVVDGGPSLTLGNVIVGECPQ